MAVLIFFVLLILSDLLVVELIVSVRHHPASVYEANKNIVMDIMPKPQSISDL